LNGHLPTTFLPWEARKSLRFLDHAQLSEEAQKRAFYRTSRPIRPHRENPPPISSHGDYYLDTFWRFGTVCSVQWLAACCAAPAVPHSQFSKSEEKLAL
jgi:hypothetical protein